MQNDSQSMLLLDPNTNCDDVITLLRHFYLLYTFILDPDFKTLGRVRCMLTVINCWYKNRYLLFASVFPSKNILTLHVNLHWKYLPLTKWTLKKVFKIDKDLNPTVNRHYRKVSCLYCTWSIVRTFCSTCFYDDAQQKDNLRAYHRPFHAQVPENCVLYSISRRIWQTRLLGSDNYVCFLLWKVKVVILKLAGGKLEVDLLFLNKV